MSQGKKSNLNEDNDHFQHSQVSENIRLNSASQHKTSFLDDVNAFVKSHVIDLVRFLFCIFFGGFIASSYFTITPSYTSANVLASSQILRSKGIKGIFPSLNGIPTDLYGTWQIGMISSEHEKMEQYKEYQIEFKKSKFLSLTRKGCQSSIKYRWMTYSYNMIIERITAKDDDLQIENTEQDLKCLEKYKEMLSILENVSIWTVHKKRLYLISEKRLNDDQAENLLMIFQKLKKSA